MRWEDQVDRTEKARRCHGIINASRIMKNTQQTQWNEYLEPEKA
jgi:hypothetical protein